MIDQANGPHWEITSAHLSQQPAVAYLFLVRLLHLWLLHESISRFYRVAHGVANFAADSVYALNQLGFRLSD
jgi:hypothetical protein